MLILKLVLTPLLVLGVSLAARVWGHRVSGWLSAAPIVAGPIMAVLLIEQGAEFTARVSIASLVAIPGLAAYMVAFAWIARRRGWVTSLLGGWLVYFAVAIPTSQLQVNAHQAMAIASLALGALYLLLPHPRTPAAPARIPRSEIGLRITAAVAMMLIISYGAEAMGARLSGVLLSFPIGGSVLPAFTRALHGVEATAHLLRGFATGLISFPAFLYGLAVGLPALHPTLAFVLALLLVFGLYFGVSVAVRRR